MGRARRYFRSSWKTAIGVETKGNKGHCQTFDRLTLCTCTE